MTPHIVAGWLGCVFIASIIAIIWILLIRELIPAKPPKITPEELIDAHNELTDMLKTSALKRILERKKNGEDI